eukprot:scaffold182227_cov13-Tisochrysis_lutea.AAC.1
MTPPACCELMRHPARTPWTRRAMPSPACVMHHKKNGGAKLQGDSDPNAHVKLVTCQVILRKSSRSTQQTLQ